MSQFSSVNLLRLYVSLTVPSGCFHIGGIFFFFVCDMVMAMVYGTKIDSLMMMMMMTVRFNLCTMALKEEKKNSRRQKKNALCECKKVGKMSKKDKGKKKKKAGTV